jgi:sugar lactone lactonase YvrE
MKKNFAKVNSMRLLSAALLTSLYSLDGLADAQIASGYKLQQLVAPSPFCGVHGLGIDGHDQLYAGSVVGQRLYKVDKTSGEVEVWVGPPKGMADDMEFLPDGTVVWTSISQNAVRALSPGGEVRDLATNLASVNSIAYRESDGKLFVAQVFGGDGLWELDIEGKKPPRNILKDMGGLNGFDIGPDDMIYGPLWFKQQLVKINPDNGDLTVIADGFHTPAAANFDSQWNLYVLDTATGEIVSVDIKTGDKTTFVQLKTSLDNLAIDSKDVLYVSNMADNSIQAIDLKTKAIRAVVEEGLSCPASLAVGINSNDDDRVYIADIFALRQVHGDSGKVTDIARSHGANTPIQYATGVFAGKAHYYVLSSGALQQYDRASDKLVQTFDHIRGAQYLSELSNGDLLVLSRRGNLLTRYSGIDKKQATVISEQLSGAASLAVLDDNTVIAALPDKNSLAKIDLSDGAIELLPYSLQTPVDIAINSPTQWLVRESQGRVISLNPDNGDKITVLDNFTAGRLNKTEGNRSNAMGIGRSGAIYLLSDIDNAIYKITPQP